VVQPAAGGAQMNESFLVRDEELRERLIGVVETCGGNVLSARAVTGYLECLSRYTSEQIRAALLTVLRTLSTHPTPAHILEILRRDAGDEERADLRFLSKSEKEAAHGKTVATLPVLGRGAPTEGCNLLVYLGHPGGYIFLDGNDPQQSLACFMGADWSQAMVPQ